MSLRTKNEIHYSKVQHWPYNSFRPQEIACKCCGNLIINDDALRRLQAFRDMVGVPVVLNSAYRCPEHNKKVGGAPASNHMEGIAFDVKILASLGRNLIHKAAYACGFQGFGDYDTFVHIDTGPKRSWDLRTKK